MDGNASKDKIEQKITYQLSKPFCRIKVRYLSQKVFRLIQIKIKSVLQLFFHPETLIY
jgi:hypothetical protein